MHDTFMCLEQGLTVSVKGQVVNAFTVESHIVSIATSQLPLCHKSSHRPSRSN
jgi:hypothetical protein